METLFPSPVSDNERSYYASYQYLQSHALLQNNLATDVGLRGKKLAHLNTLCARFLCGSSVTSESVKFATQAVAIAQESLFPHDMDLYIEKTACLIANTQY